MVSCLSLRSVISVSPTWISPDVGRSRPARTCRRVDLPDPDGPMMAVNSRALIPMLTSSSAMTAASPSPYCLLTCSARATAEVVGGRGVMMVLMEAPCLWAAGPAGEPTTGNDGAESDPMGLDVRLGWLPPG